MKKYELIHSAWRKQIKLLMKIINSRELTKKEVFLLIDVFNNNLFSCFKGFDVKYLFKLSESLDEVKCRVDEKYKQAIILRPTTKRKTKHFRL